MWSASLPHVTSFCQEPQRLLCLCRCFLFLLFRRMFISSRQGKVNCLSRCSWTPLEIRWCIDYYQKTDCFRNFSISPNALLFGHSVGSPGESWFVNHPSRWVCNRPLHCSSAAPPITAPTASTSHNSPPHHTSPAPTSASQKTSGRIGSCSPRSAATASTTSSPLSRR